MMAMYEAMNINRSASVAEHLEQSFRTAIMLQMLMTSTLNREVLASPR